MKAARRFLLPVLASALLIGPAAAQSVDSITAVDGRAPGMAKGKIGTTVTIAGTGFTGAGGLSKPVAQLFDPVSQKAFKLKVSLVSDIEITALITKAVYGTLDVQVIVDDATLSLPGGFEVPLPTVDSVAPMDHVGTLGTNVVITGTGLLGIKGNGKPKVYLQDTVTLKKFNLKVLESSETEITAIITKAVAGSFDLIVVAKGAPALTGVAGFTVPLPNISAINPGFAFAGETVTLTCEHVGNKKPKVKVGKKSGKVVSFTNEQVVFLMPKKLSKGVQTLQLITKVGTATQIAGIINQGDAPDTSTADKLTATVGKTKFVAGGALFFSVFTVYDPGPRAITTITGSKVNPDTFETEAAFTLRVPFDPATFTEPVAIVDAPDGFIEYQIPSPELFADPISLWTSDAPGGSYAVTILDVDEVDAGGSMGFLLRGAFEGTLKLTVGTGADPQPVTSGEVTTTFTP